MKLNSIQYTIFQTPAQQPDLPNDASYWNSQPSEPNTQCHEVPEPLYFSIMNSLTCETLIVQSGNPTVTTTQHTFFMILPDINLSGTTCFPQLSSLVFYATEWITDVKNILNLLPASCVLSLTSFYLQEYKNLLVWDRSLQFDQLKSWAVDSKYTERLRGSNFPDFYLFRIIRKTYRNPTVLSHSTFSWSS